MKPPSRGKAQGNNGIRASAMSHLIPMKSSWLTVARSTVLSFSFASGCWVTQGGIEGSFPPCVRAPRQPSAVPAVVKQQSALIAVPEEWILLLSGV
jgi:hypothetical protein